MSRENLSRQNRPPATPVAPERSSERPRTRRQFDEAVNRIIMDAARTAADQEAESGAMATALSRESFLTPLVDKARESLAGRNHWNSSEREWMRAQERRVRGWNLRERLHWKPPVASPPAADAAASSLEWKLLAAPVVFGAVVLLLAPVWVRLRPKLAAYLQASATLASLRSLEIDSPQELVAAVDRFLLATFGLSAAWWHCRKVGRELRRLRPELSGEIEELADLYELARFGPDATTISAESLERAASTLRRLAEGPAAEPALWAGAA
jgi:hypothetical protein